MTRHEQLTQQLGGFAGKPKKQTNLTIPEQQMIKMEIWMEKTEKRLATIERRIKRIARIDKRLRTLEGGDK